MVTPTLAGLAIHVTARCRKDPLPCPFSPRVGILALKRTRKDDPAGTLAEIPLMLAPHRLKVSREVGLGRRGEQCRSILLTRTVSNQNLIRRKIDVLDTQTRVFHQSEAGAVEQGPHQSWDPAKMSQHSLHLRLGQHAGRRVGRLARMMPSSYGSFCCRTSCYRKSTALRA